jgi:hypothetical protein
MPLPRGHIAVCVSAIALVSPASALSDDFPTPPTGTPSIAQYIETVPSTAGGWSAGPGSTRSKALPPAVARHLRQQPDYLTKQLKDVATSSTYGAPQHGLSRPPKSDEQATTPLDESSTFDAAIGAVSSSDDSQIYWLLAAMIVVTTTMVWASARRNSR